MNFSIIIVNFNTKKTTKDCLNSIFSHCLGSDFEVIVVDNGSVDGSVELLAADFDRRIKLIKNRCNIGFGPANNLAAQTARGRYLFFLNSDIIVKGDILAPIKRIFAADKNIGVVSPKLLLASGREQAYAYGTFPGLLSLLRNKLAAWRPVASGNLFKVDWVSGAAMAVRKNIFDRVGGFDRRFFMYFEDIDLCRRVVKLGYRVVVVPRVKVIHLGGQSLAKFSQRKKYYYQSQNYYWQKHCGRGKTLLMRALRIPFIIFSAMRIRWMWPKK